MFPRAQAFVTVRLSIRLDTTFAFLCSVTIATLNRTCCGLYVCVVWVVLPILIILDHTLPYATCACLCAITMSVCIAYMVCAFCSCVCAHMCLCVSCMHQLSHQPRQPSKASCKGHCAESSGCNQRTSRYESIHRL